MHIQPNSLFDKALNNLEHTPLPVDPCPGHAQARAHHFRYDQRATGPREADYLKALNLQEGTAVEIRERHEFYVKEFVWGGLLPSTFSPGNEAAFLGPLANTQDLVRVESLDQLLEKWKSRDHLASVDSAFDFLQKAVSDFQDKKAGDMEHTQAVATLDRFLTSWNRQRDGRPMFATFEDGLRDLINAPTGRRNCAIAWDWRTSSRKGEAKFPLL